MSALELLLAVSIALAIGSLALLAALLALSRSRREIEGELHAATQIIDRANDAVLVADIIEGRILHANPAACRLVGVERGALLASTLPDLHPPAMRGRSAELVADVWEKKGLTYDDLAFVAADGTSIDVEISGSVFEFRGKPSILLHARDIRPRRRLEAERATADEKVRAYAKELEATNRELRDAQAQLVQSEKMASLGNLVAGIAHEINNPVGAIAANADVSRRAIEILRASATAQPPDDGAPTPDRTARALKALDEVTRATATAAERISGIVKSLKNFARLDEAELKRVDLHEGIESTLTLLQHVLRDRIEVVREYGRLPELACHPNQLNQVFMHLLQNAIDAMPGPGRITIATREEDGHAVLAFSDSGKGIAPEHRSRVFDPGFTTKGNGVGTGLGLSICYRIVQNHQGTIALESELDRGATFTIRLPLR